VVRDDNCQSVELIFQLAHEPRFARFMERNGILRRKSSPAVLDRREVFDQSLRPSPCEPGLPFTVQIKVGPQRTAQKPNSFETGAAAFN